MMAAVAHGADRQAIHESIRQHSRAASLVVNEEGLPNDLLERLKRDPVYAGLDIDGLVDPLAFVGRSPEQVDEFVSSVVAPIRARYGADEAPAVEIKV